MDSNLTTLARALVALPGFEWRAGMLAVEDGGPGAVRVTDATVMVVGTGQHSTYFRDWVLTRKGRGWLPDLTDDATGGCLLAMLGPGWAARRTESRWAVFRPGVSVLEDPDIYGQSLAEAAARALVAIGRVP